MMGYFYFLFTMKILMVCLGNICRSPLAEGILRKKAAEYALNIEVDSAGFEYCNRGMSPDLRSVEVAQKHGVDINDIRSRMFEYSDFLHFDKIYVMDRYNYNDVMNMARTEQDKSKVKYILDEVYPGENCSIKDPYYGGKDGFTTVYNQLNEACEAICRRMITERNFLINIVD